jgi:hypothetical protein
LCECNPGYHHVSGQCKQCPGQDVAYVILCKHLLQ